MDKTEIFLEDGTKKLVSCIFYLYNSSYYFLYTENEKDENGYIKLYLVKVGKETVNSENGPVETGNMIGIEIQTDDEWKDVQASISKIVNSKKTKVDDSSIQYLPISMLVNLKIISKKTFRLLSDIIEKDFGVSLNEMSVEDQTKNNIDIVDLNKSDEESFESSSQVVEPIVPDNLSVTSDKIQDINKEDEVLQTDKLIDELDSSIDSNKENTKKDENNEIGKDSFEITTGEVEPEEDYENSNIIIDYRTRFFEEQEKNKKLQEEIDALNKKLLNIKEIIG